MFPLFIPSYNRPEPVALRWTRELPDSAPYWYVVREEQLEAYSRSIQKDHLLIIPEGAVTGLGETRNFIYRHAAELRMPYIFDFDDDITYLRYCYLKSGGRPSKTINSDHIRIPRLTYRILEEVSDTARWLYKKHPKLVLGNLHRQRFSQWDHPYVAKILGGSTPRQTKILNIQRLHKHGLYVPPEFNMHGEDVGHTAHILNEGFQTFQILPYIYDFVSEQVDSTVRDAKHPEKNRPLHRKEYNDLQAYEMGREYLKISKTYPDGEYMFGDVSWREYHKLKGTKSTKESIYDIDYGHVAMPILRSQKEGGL